MAGQTISHYRHPRYVSTNFDVAANGKPFLFSPPRAAMHVVLNWAAGLAR